MSKNYLDTYDAPARRSETAQALMDRRYARRIVQAQKGAGSYNRKCRRWRKGEE